MSPDADFLRALERHLSAIAQRDIDGFATTVAGDVRLVGTDGALTEGARRAVEAHRAWFADETWEFDPSERVLAASAGDAGWALIRVKYAVGERTTRFNLFLLFTRESDGAWRLRYDQGTTIDS